MKLYSPTTDDWEDLTPEEREDLPTKRPKKKSAPMPQSEPPQPVIYPGTLEAFMEEYEPVAFIEDADEIFTFGKLREYFNAVVPFGMPDAMPTIISALTSHHFRLVSYLGMEQAIIVRRRKIPTVTADGEIIEDSTPEVRSISL